MRSVVKHAAWLCLLLTFSSVYASATHDHTSSVEAAKCVICVAAHSASPVAAPKLPSANFAPVSTVIPQRISAQQRLEAFALSVRPPPGI